MFSENRYAQKSNLLKTIAACLVIYHFATKTTWTKVGLILLRRFSASLNMWCIAVCILAGNDLAAVNLLISFYKSSIFQNTAHPMWWQLLMILIIWRDSFHHFLLTLQSKYLILQIGEDICLAEQEVQLVWFGTDFTTYITAWNRGTKLICSCSQVFLILSKLVSKTLENTFISDTGMQQKIDIKSPVSEAGKCEALVTVYPSKSKYYSNSWRCTWF